MRRPGWCRLVAPPGLLNDSVDLVERVDLFRRESDHFLVGMTLQRRDDPRCCRCVLDGLQCQEQLGLLDKSFGVGGAVLLQAVEWWLYSGGRKIEQQQSAKTTGRGSLQDAGCVTDLSSAAARVTVTENTL